MAELGAPDQVAAEFNAAFAGEPAPRKIPWRWQERSGLCPQRRAALRDRVGVGPALPAPLKNIFALFHTFFRAGLDKPGAVC